MENECKNAKSVVNDSPLCGKSIDATIDSSMRAPRRGKRAEIVSP